ncbi:hypothetical protein VP1G_11081 [Cytospora mali]|uniref:Uncharacterized protein n=1 Tax=Cytospora mali TaxID=578113 RepID=A0A194V714_CYTMA|nr:hypothetical protein VP1G_11081 [Valsa mali var. pyri (nom. inval.)]
MEGEQEDDDLAIESSASKSTGAKEHLKKHIDDLGPDIYAIEVSKDCELISVSANSEDDVTLCPHYPSLKELKRLGGMQTVLRSRLQELDRLGPNVDLVSYKTNSLTIKEGEPRFERDKDNSSVLDLKEWVQHPDVRLDDPLAEYRAVLDEWLRTRKTRENVTIFTEAPEYIDWPGMQEPPCFPDENTSLQETHEDTQHSVYTPDQGDTPEEAPRDSLSGDGS